MDLRQYLRILAGRKYLIAAAVAVSLGVAAALTFLPAREWSASTTMQVQPAAALVGGSVRPDDVTYLDRLINTYSEMVASPEFGDRVARHADLSARPTLVVTAPSNTNLIAIEATTTSAAAAARAANAGANELVSRISKGNLADMRAADKTFDARVAEIESSVAKAHVRLVDLRHGPQTKAAREAEVKLEEQIAGQRVSMNALRNAHEAQRSAQAARASTVAVVANATAPPAPISRHLGMVLPLGLMLGLLLGCALAFAADNLARRFRSEGEIEAALETPVMATIPRARRAGNFVLFSRGSREHEAIQRLRTQLLLADRAARILVVSAERGEGKSTLATNLACSVADSGRTVMLVDADLRLPTVHAFFREENEAGLSSLLSEPSLAGSLHWQRFACRLEGDGPSILPAGPPVVDPPMMLGSHAMSRLLDEISLSFDMIILDTPALLAVSDALVLAPLVDTVILVAGSHVDPDALRLAHRQLLRAGGSPVGLVINGSDDAGVSRYVDYHTASA